MPRPVWTGRTIELHGSCCFNSLPDGRRNNLTSCQQQSRIKTGGQSTSSHHRNAHSKAVARSDCVLSDRAAASTQGKKERREVIHLIRLLGVTTFKTSIYDLALCSQSDPVLQRAGPSNLGVGVGTPGLVGAGMGLGAGGG